MASQLTESSGSGAPRAGSITPRCELTFEWKESRARQRLRIAFFFVLAMLLHAGFFYVFRVMYPSSTQSLPMPSRVLLLSEDDPSQRIEVAIAVRSILAEVEDRTAAYDPSLGTPVGAARLGDYTTYLPSFAGHQLPLKDLPIDVAERLPLPEALPGRLALPAPEQLPPPDRPASGPLPAKPEQPALAFGGRIARRSLLRQPALAGIFGVDANAVTTFAIGVDASGVVRHCMPDEDFQADQLEALRRAQSQSDQSHADRLMALRRALCQMRFVPEPGASLTWGFVTVEW